MSNKIKIGDYVEFKSDYERVGKVVAIRPNGEVTIECYDSNTGGHEHFYEHVSRCFKQED